MRWLFLILLTINLVLVYWSWQLSNQDGRLVDVEVLEIGDLKLLSEREMARIDSGSEEIESDGIQNVPQNNDGFDIRIRTKLSQDRETTEPDDTVIAENEALNSKSIDLGITESLPETLESPDVVDLSSSLAIPEISEDQTIGQLEQPAAPYSETVTPDASLKEPNTPVSFCGSLGPLLEGEIAKSAIEMLEDRGIKASLRRETKKQQAGFWVIIPPYRDRNTAVEAAKRLKELGFTDIWRFYKGEFKNGISLGMYSRRRNAETRRDSIVATGFFPEVLPRYRDVAMHWIDYRVEGEENLSALDTALVAYPELKQKKAKCPHIAEH